MQVEELRGFFPTTDRPIQPYLECYPVERKNSLMSHSIPSPDLTCNCTVEKGDSDTTLYLGYVSFYILVSLLWKCPNLTFFFLFNHLLLERINQGCVFGFELNSTLISKASDHPCKRQNLITVALLPLVPVKWFTLVGLSWQMIYSGCINAFLPTTSRPSTASEIVELINTSFSSPSLLPLQAKMNLLLPSLCYYDKLFSFSFFNILSALNYALSVYLSGCQVIITRERKLK